MLQNFLLTMQGLVVVGLALGLLVGLASPNWKVGCLALLPVPVVMFYFAVGMFVAPSFLALGGFVIGRWLRPHLFRR